VGHVLSLLHKKQNELNDCMKEKRQLESEIEFVWQATSAENRSLKESLLVSNRSLSASYHGSLRRSEKLMDFRKVDSKMGMDGGVREVR